MKKYYFLIIVVLILGLALTGCSLLTNVGQVPATEQSGIAYLTKGETKVIPLLAGQDIPVGTVNVRNDGVNLYVKYETTGDWVMTETHLAVVTEFEHFPTTNKGNPKVGHFPYGEENIFTDTWEKIIELSAISAVAGQELFIAAHAVVADTSITKEEVVVSRPGIDAYGPLDDYAGLGDIIWSSANPAVAAWVHGSWPWQTDPDGATWISTAENTEEPVANSSWRWFHDEITIPGYPLAGTVSVTADNAEEVYLNGVSIGSNSNWGVISNYPIVPQPGLNTLDFIVENYGGSSNPEHNPTGLIYKATISYYPEESAWADGIRFTDPGNWATYFTYEVQIGYLADLIPAVNMFPGSVYVNIHQIPGSEGKVIVTQPYDNEVTLTVSVDGLGFNEKYKVCFDKSGITPGSVSTAGPSWETMGFFWTDGSGHGDWYYTYLAGSLVAGNYTWSVFINRQDPNATVLISYNIEFEIK